MLKYKHIFQIKYTEAILSNSTGKLLWFEITKMLIAVLKIYRVIRSSKCECVLKTEYFERIYHVCGLRIRLLTIMEPKTPNENNCFVYK